MSNISSVKKIKKCKKDHICCQCNIIIPKGNAYMIHSGIYDDSAFTQKFHNECYELHLENNKDSDNDEWFDIFECDYDVARKRQVHNLFKYKNNIPHYVVYLQEKDGDKYKAHYVTTDLDRANEAYQRKMYVTKKETKGTVQLEHILSGKSYVHKYHWYRNWSGEVNGRHFSPPKEQPEGCSHV